MLLSKFSNNNNKIEKNLNDITNAFQDDNSEEISSTSKNSMSKSSRFEIENAASLTYNFNFDRLSKK